MRFGVYVDGSYFKAQPDITYGGFVIVNEDTKEVLQARRCYSKRDMFTSMNNVGGELIATIFGTASISSMLNAIENITDVTVYHDYVGISSFIDGKWTPNKPGAKVYTKMTREAINSNPKLQFKFKKVKAHTGNEFNELADRVAKGETPNNLVDVILPCIDL